MKKIMHLTAVVFFLLICHTLSAQVKSKLHVVKKSSPVYATSPALRTNGLDDPGGYTCATADPGSDATISCGSSTTIGGSYNPNYFYSWYPTAGLSSSTQLNPTASPLGTTTYTLTMTPKPNLLINGSFESGNTGFSTDYSYGISLGNYTTYTIANKPTDVYNWWCNTEPPRGTNALIVDGATSANQRVWYQTISITPSTYYSFSGQFMNIYSTYGVNDPNIVVKINGTSLGNQVLTFNNCDWTTLSAGWISGSSDYTATIAIYSEPSSYSGDGNDFAIDNLVFNVGDCPITTAPVTVTVTGVPTISPSGPIEVCYYWEPSFTTTLTTNLTSNIRWSIRGHDFPDSTNSSFTLREETLRLYDSTPRSTLYYSSPFTVKDLSTGCISDPVIIKAIQLPEVALLSGTTYGTGFALSGYVYPYPWIGSPIGYGTSSSIAWKITSPTSAIPLSDTSLYPVSFYVPDVPNEASIPPVYLTYKLTLSGSDFSCANTSLETSYDWLEFVTDYLHVFAKTKDSSVVRNSRLTGENFNNEKNILIYPNPAKNNFTIAAIDEFDKVQIFSSKGALMKTINTKGRTADINAGGLLPGSYFVNILSAKGTTVKKLIVIK